MTLPTGTVTFVFSDIEESSDLVKRFAERYGEILAAHRRLIRASFGEAEVRRDQPSPAVDSW
jgi:hypothetical protein